MIIFCVDPSSKYTGFVMYMISWLGYNEDGYLWAK